MKTKITFKKLQISGVANLRFATLLQGSPWGQKGPRRGPLRGQAAIFDGIMFLLLVSFSVAMMFSFLSDYGTAQSRILRSSHSLNYVQSIGKTLYSLDVSTLTSTELPPVFGSDAPLQCSELVKFRSNSVADLVKRDVSDGKFDNKYSTVERDGPNSPGRLALRCALYELMKPVVQSGFDYNAEILDGDSNFRPFPIDPNDPEQYLITNLADDDVIYQAALHGASGGDGTSNGCGSISSALKGKQLLAIATPFRVFNEAPDSEPSDSQRKDHQLRICMWPSERQ
ncbi:MAG: hypothetical protein Q8R15_05255 [Candidatus Micrarchaeota archaeon]|nr:hypothetical protein [Candidatus Micrarchaeota archaeon]